MKLLHSKAWHYPRGQLVSPHPRKPGIGQQRTLLFRHRRHRSRRNRLELRRASSIPRKSTQKPHGVPAGNLSLVLIAPVLPNHLFTRFTSLSSALFACTSTSRARSPFNGRTVEATSVAIAMLRGYPRKRWKRSLPRGTLPDHVLHMLP